MIKIYTSYFANIKSIPDTIVTVSIAGKAPLWYKGLEYKKLAPKFWFFDEWKTKGLSNEWYTEQYTKEVLEPLNVEDVLADLERLSGGKDVALLCYEKPGSFCHRQLVANWIADYINKVTLEKTFTRENTTNG